MESKGKIQDRAEGLEALLQARRSVRAFEAAEVPREHLVRVLQAGTEAPSAGNVQPWRFVVVRRATARRLLAQAAWDQEFVAQAPAVITVCADLARSGQAYGQRGRELYCLQDGAAAALSMLLMAEALGLGACWVGAFDESQVRAALQLDEQVRPLALLPVGWPAERPARPPRHPVEAVTAWLD
ncbi:MAG TPA: nitroreductase family protein [Myxococcota bacterium]|nr:nitroreductase family protein [Myxococcota bacterium]HRY93259.1 nitroreductase family protein [Myxococcota bacterium]HSA19959.1 nitroreductase family protein [Myxococcota bacterium]